MFNDSYRCGWCGIIAGLVKSDTGRQRLATVAVFLQSCVAQALSRGNDPPLVTSQYRECNEDLILI